MSQSDELLSADDELTDRLLAYDEALARGTQPIADAATEEERTRLERGLACLQLLQTLRPAKPVENDWECTTSIMRRPGKEPTTEHETADQPIRIGRFEVRQSLGSGGFGIVYRAYDPTLCRDIALKIPRAGALAEAGCLARFEREAKSAAGLNHPNIVSVHEAGRVGPVSYIALAYCPGQNLGEWLRDRSTPLGHVPAAQLVQVLARAVHYAHAHGILHRDLKPNNVLLTPLAEAGHDAAPTPVAGEAATDSWFPEPQVGYVPRVTDFGLARHLAGDQDQTQTGTILGTPCYMAPEQAQSGGPGAGPATDVYSLGAILYELITGLPPFRAETAMETLLLVKTTDPVPPCRLQPRVPRDLETICLKCLQKDPRKRYAGADLLADDLQRFRTSRPIFARPANTLERTFKWCKRRPALAVACLALTLVTAVGFVGILRQWSQTQVALADEATARMHAESMQRAALQAQQAEAAAREQSEIALYHHRVVLAHREWLASNVGRATQLLDQCREDLRGWEWHYVRRLCDSANCTLRGHGAPVMAAAFSPDGKLVASVSGKWFSSDTGEQKVWDAASGQVLWTRLSIDAPLMSVAFVPGGKHLVTASVSWGKPGGEVRLWDVGSGELLHTFRDARGTFSVAVSPDCSLLAGGGADGKIRLWNLVSKQPVAILEAHASNIFGLGFTPDGKLLASCGWDGVARVWDVEQRKLVRALSGPVDLRSVEFSPDGKRLLAASFDQSAKIWEVSTGRLLRTYWGHTAALSSARFSPDGRYVVSSDTSGGIHVWNAQTLRLFRTIRGHTGSVGGVAFSPDGMQVATTGTDRLVRIWDITTDQEALALDQTGPTQNVVFSPDGKWLAAAGFRHSSGVRREARVRVWPTNDFTKQSAWTGHTDWVTSVAFRPGQQQLVSGSADKTARLWNLADGKTLREFVGHKEAVAGVCCSPDGRLLATASLDRSVKLWDCETGKPLGLVLGHPFPVQDVVFSRDGRQIVAVGENGMVKVWDTQTARELCALSGHQGLVERVQLSPDGALLATCGRDQTIRVWDMKLRPGDSGAIEPVRVLVSPSEWERVSGLAFSADGTRLASGGRDHTIRIWDLASGSETLTLRGNLDHVNGLAFSPDGNLLASASTRNIRVWNAGADSASSTHSAEAQTHVAELWHRKQADEAQAARPGQWFAAAFHLTHLLGTSGKDWQLLLRRADVEAELDQWKGVHDDCARSITAGAKDPWAWVLLAVERLRNGDIVGYKTTCVEMLTRFEKTKDNEYANNVAWACALAPNGVENYGLALRLATQAATANPTGAAYQSTLGAILFRDGKFQQARDVLQRATTLSKDDTPEDWLLLAMTCQQLGERSEAIRWLHKETKWQDRVKSSRVLEEDDKGFSHERMIEIGLLRGETEGMLRTKAIPVVENRK